jgi:hypothetical protein
MATTSVKHVVKFGNNQSTELQEKESDVIRRIRLARWHHRGRIANLRGGCRGVGLRPSARSGCGWRTFGKP